MGKAGNQLPLQCIALQGKALMLPGTLLRAEE
jgi:hypothetical protein